MKLISYIIGLLTNLTLSNDKTKSNKVDKLINFIIKKLDIIASVVKNNKVDSLNNRINKNCL